MRDHLPALDDEVMDPVATLYAIRIKGQLGATVLCAFPAMVPRRLEADTVLTGVLDRSALFGVLAEIEALGLELIEVRQLTLEAGSVKVRRALEIAAATAETSASLNDLLSSLRIEVMAAEGEFEQFSQGIPRASYELIRQSLKDAAAHCDAARELLRKLREVAE